MEAYNTMKNRKLTQAMLAKQSVKTVLSYIITMKIKTRYQKICHQYFESRLANFDNIKVYVEHFEDMLKELMALRDVVLSEIATELGYDYQTEFTHMITKEQIRWGKDPNGGEEDEML